MWHEGFDAKRQPIITIQLLEENFAALLREPLSRVGERNTVSDHVAWQEMFDSLRLSRYALQYPSGLDPEVRWVLPDRERAASIVETGESNAALYRNLLRLDLAVLDILMTAASLPNAMNFVRGFAARLPAAITNRASIITQIVEMYRPNLTFLGALVFRQRNDARLRLRLMTRSENGLSNGGFNSLIPWTYLWSLGTGDDDCCRHEDFKNGVAVLSWRPNITSDRYSHAQAFKFAPAAQIARYAPYGDEAEDEVLAARGLYSVPGIVRVGVSLTLRFDHAYMAQLLGRNVAMSVGLVSSEATQ